MDGLRILKRETRESLMVDFVLMIFRDGDIYHRVRNGKTRLTVVSVAGMVAEKAWGGVIPPNGAVRIGFLLGLIATHSWR